ncbi:hypothetical protein DPSP01_012431 [Paraphaeosphaeria sporulosa]|uniref:Uncharacterized protein n=1 Tax=Paraphaeosphaeria sporulosa TaxID=1460663 RepID=A0A177C443_9PLEO|nr:uncharacterized protein CC84DRAFT_1221139 [Paraphaeosphaeria sporulosa]OAG01652.1 hypothetical protein CC84DRAFT_1221139 [Paraphaeosphaeria sporulosa]
MRFHHLDRLKFSFHHQLQAPHSVMRGAFRDKFAFELFIEKTWNAIQSCITELATGTWLEYFVLDPVGQYVAVAAIALILSLCVGRFHILLNAWKMVVNKAFARIKDDNANHSGYGACDSDKPTAAGDEDSPNDVQNKQEAAKLANRLENVHIATRKTTSSLAPHFRPQQNPNMLIEPDANTVSVLKYQTPPRRPDLMTTEGDPETIKKRKDQLDRLRMWS